MEYYYLIAYLLANWLTTILKWSNQLKKNCKTFPLLLLYPVHLPQYIIKMQIIFTRAMIKNQQIDSKQQKTKINKYIFGKWNFESTTLDHGIYLVY